MNTSAYFDDAPEDFAAVDIRSFVQLTNIERSVGDDDDQSPTTPATPGTSDGLNDFPAFCSLSAIDSCRNVTLSQCEQCNMSAAGIWITLCLLIGTATVLGNVFVILLTIKKRPGFTGYYNKIRASLAIADLLAGLELIFLTTCNFGWTVNLTAERLISVQKESYNSVLAIAFGMLHVFRLTSSLYHLVLLGIHRVYAILYPIHFRRQTAKAKSAYVGILIVWFGAIIAAVAPVCFPAVFSYTYYSTVLMYNLTLASNYTDVTRLAVMVFFLFILPFTFMTILGISTVIMTHLKMFRRFANHKEDSPAAEAEIASARRREIIVCYIVAIMQLGFTITIVPIVVVVTLSHLGFLVGEELSTSYFVCFYISLTNSLVNVLIYSARDKRYVDGVRKLLSSAFSGAARGRSLSHSSSAYTSATKLRHNAGVRCQSSC